MKKKLSLILCACFCAAVFSKPSKIPEWVQDYKKVYPDSEFIAQRGSGTKAELAKNEAAAAISRYFESKVSANISTTTSLVTTKDSSDESKNSVKENKNVVNEVSVQSQVEFSGLEYTEPYYLKSEKKWYCVAYLNRENAWQQLQPEIEIKKNSFNGLYKKLQKENDYWTKAQLCSKVWHSGEELLEKLEYARIISAQKEAAYENERNEISSVPVLFEEAKENCSVFFKINSDYNRTISSAVSNALNKSGIQVSKTEAAANYIADIEVEDNLSGDDPLSIKPGVNIKIVSSSGKTVYSFEIISEEKAAAYSLEAAQKKIYPKLSKKIEEAVYENLAGSFSL